MDMYSALITDLDGTVVALASNGVDIDEQTAQAVQAAIDNGKLITCATGREWEEAEPIIRKLGIVTPCIIEGGTRIVEPLSGRTVWQKAFETGGSERVLKILYSITDQGILMHSADRKRSPLALQTQLPSDNLRFIYLLAVSQEVAERICNQINQTDSAEVAHLTPSWYGNGFIDVHITHREATKEHAIAVWQKLYGLAPQDTVGMGDSGNDIPIFESCGLKVAVENATLALKSVADIIVPSYDQHALCYVLEKYLSD